jgi:hypothetical protein
LNYVIVIVGIWKLSALVQILAELPRVWVLSCYFGAVYTM